MFYFGKVDHFNFPAPFCSINRRISKSEKLNFIFYRSPGFFIFQVAENIRLFLRKLIFAFVEMKV